MSTEGQSRLETVKAEAEKLIDFYKKLQEMSLPDSIVAVSDEIETDAEKYVPMLPSKTMKQYRQRGETIESINGALQNMEKQIVINLTVSPSSVLFKQVHNVLKKWEWFAGHIGFLTTSFIEFCDAFDNQVTAQFEKHPEQPRQILNFISEGLVAESVFPGEENKSEHLGATGVALGQLLIESACSGLVATVLEAVVVAWASGKFATMTVPVIEANNGANGEIIGAALPQGTARHRRKKIHRLRA